MAVIDQFIPDYDEPVMHQSTTGKAEVSAVSSTHRRRIAPLPDPSRLSRLPLASTTSSKFIVSSPNTTHLNDMGIPGGFAKNFTSTSAVWPAALICSHRTCPHVEFNLCYVCVTLLGSAVPLPIDVVIPRQGCMALRYSGAVLSGVFNLVFHPRLAI
ncbi:hypothetical protein EV401DRAFT_2016740 [Pisolithus croceorrhizus]|nr:hypothetical protein EV401DRAFT_2016740 [Pisolithus croceorrhizus]